LAIYRVSQAKIGLSALALKRHLSASYPTAWLVHYKLMQAMTGREARYKLSRFDLKTLTQRLLVAAAPCGAHSQHSIRTVAEVHC
jgi:hypothetical protein